MRSPSILLVEKLVVGQEKAILYYGDGIAFLMTQLPDLLDGDIEGVFNGIPPDPKVLTSKSTILEQGLSMIRATDSLEDALYAYDKIGIELRQDFQTMENIIIMLEQDLVTESVAYKFFKLIFQNQQFPTIIQFFLQFLTRGSDDMFKDLNIVQDNLNSITDFDECMAYNIEYAEAIVKNYRIIYSFKDPIEAKCFNLSITKEIFFDPNLKEEYEDSCENKILRKILNNEAESSPNSFTDEECKILDFMELATFHVDTTPKIAFFIRTIVATTAVKLDYLKDASYNVDLNNLNNFKKVFSNFEHRMEQFASQLISKGTMGMSQNSSASTLITFLKEFESILKPIILITKQISVNIGRNIPDKKDIIKEEAHFAEALNSYLHSLTELNRFVHNRTIASIIETAKVEFEQVDTKLKYQFFELIYFNQRLGFELEIMNQLQHREQ